MEQHFVRDSRGWVSAAGPSSADYGFWQRYLDAFEEVLVLARVRTSRADVLEANRADGPGVVFHDLADYLGPWQYLRCLPILRQRVREAVEQSDVVILRVPGAVGRLAWKIARSEAKPFAVEVVGDPWDVFSPGAARTVVRPLVRRIFARELRQMCREAFAVAYVTRGTLQRRYPPSDGAFVTYFSNVAVERAVVSRDQLEARIAKLRRRWDSGCLRGLPARVGTVGTLAQLYKAPDILLRAVAACLAKGLDMELEFVGDGTYKREMESLAKRLGIADRVRFLGTVPPGQAVYHLLDTWDLFVLPSRTEGLPRAMIEAMARGCPCIGSTVGGIPELLPAEDLVPPDNAHALARKIREVLSDPQRMERMARRNWEATKDYLPEVLGERRRAFYGKVRDLAASAASCEM